MFLVRDNCLAKLSLVRVMCKHFYFVCDPFTHSVYQPSYGVTINKGGVYWSQDTDGIQKLVILKYEKIMTS